MFIDHEKLGYYMYFRIKHGQPTRKEIQDKTASYLSGGAIVEKLPTIQEQIEDRSINLRTIGQRVMLGESFYGIDSGCREIATTRWRIVRIKGRKRSGE